MVQEGDLRIISSPMDFMGLNIYSGTWIKGKNIKEPDKSGNYEKQSLKENFFEEVPFPDDHPKTFMGWPIVPEAAYWSVRFFKEYYPDIPVYMTENGCSFNDRLTDDQKINDEQRIDFLQTHLSHVQRLLQEGIEIHGYFVWSLMDNFEWTLGYSKRFGLVYIDYPTQKRIPKQSYYWYKNFIQQAIKNST